MEGHWTVSDDAGHVRLRSGRIGLMTVDVRAPVISGSLTVDRSGIEFDLELALDRLTTGNPLMQAAARALVTNNDARRLTYAATGLTVSPWQVTGTAQAGTISLALGLLIRPDGPASEVTTLAINGTANVGTVHLPLPGLGTVRDFAFDVEGSLTVVSSS